MSLGPFDLTGTTFLALYILLLAAAVVAGLFIPRRLRPAGRAQRVTDVDQLAFLAGGSARFGEAVVARLLAARALVMADGKSFRAVSGGSPGSAVERSLLALPSPIGWQELEAVLKSYREPLERRMVAAGLLMSREEADSIRLRAVLPYLLLLGFGTLKLIVGTIRDRPVGYLAGLLILTGAIAIIRAVSIDRRTQAGHDAVARATEESRRLKIAPTTPEIDIAVALFGTAVLAGSDWADFHRLRQAGGSDGGSGGVDGGSGGDGGGAGGCSGGGCGGCGS